MQTAGANGWKVSNRSETTQALRLMVGLCGRAPSEYARYSGRIGGAALLDVKWATPLQIQRAGRWKFQAFMAYAREGGERQGEVSRVLLGLGGIRYGLGRAVHRGTSDQSKTRVSPVSRNARRAVGTSQRLPRSRDGCMVDDPATTMHSSGTLEDKTK